MMKKIRGEIGKSRKPRILIIAGMILMVVACGLSVIAGGVAYGASTDSSKSTFQDESANNATTIASSKRVDALSYRMSLKLDTRKNALKETVTMRFRNNTDGMVREIWIRDMTPAKLRYDMKNYPESNKKLKTKISSITLKGSSKKLKVKYKKKRSAIKVDLGAKGKLKPGETGAITVRLKTHIPNRADRFGYQKTKKGKLYALSFCFPYLADNLNGKWQLDPYFDDGESRSWDLADYNVTFRAPVSYKVAATGKVVKTTVKGSKSTAKSTKAKAKIGITKIKARNVRDFAIVACNFMAKDSFDVEGIRVNNYYLSGKHKAEYRKLTRLVAEDSIRLYTQQLGECPYDEIDIAPCLFGFGFGGMEYPGLIMTNASSTFNTSLPDYMSLSDGLSHELGHQWFYAAVGNREYKEAWIDEGFTTYIERDIYGLYDGDAYKYLSKIDDLTPTIDKMKEDRDYLLETARKDYKGVFINIPPDKYPRGRDYGEVEYMASYCFLEEVRLRMGDEKFAEFLRGYYNKYKMDVVTTRDVVNYIKEYDKSREMQEIIDFYIAGYQRGQAQ